MKIYKVGGSIRDEFLGRKPNEIDYLVVGSTPEEMIKNKFKPIGKNFPVFIHPETKAEYALARTEKKVSRGYKGFKFFTSPDITLFEDLLRRDLTINSIAKDENNNFYDPFGGINDIKNKILRHIGPSFVEDPVRLLRLAKFSARLNFKKIAPETKKLLLKMVESGETLFLQPERVWKELSEGFMSSQPSLMIKILFEVNFFNSFFPGLKNFYQNKNSEYLYKKLDELAKKNLAIEIRVSFFLFFMFCKLKITSKIKVNEIYGKLNAPKKIINLTNLLIFNYKKIEIININDSISVLDFLQKLDSIRNYKNFDRFLFILQSYHENNIPTLVNLRFLDKANKELKSINFENQLNENINVDSIKNKVLKIKLRVLKKIQKEENFD